MARARKLNIFQRGLIQKILGLAVYFIVILFFLLGSSALEKYRLTQSIEQAQQQGSITLEMAEHFKQIQFPVSRFDAFWNILLAVFILGFGWLFGRYATWLNLSWPVTLPAAIEFLTAMHKLGLKDLEEQLAYIKRHRLPVYIAEAPILNENRQNVFARLSPYASHRLLAWKQVIASNIGSRQLCLDSDDYEPLYQEYAQGAREDSVTKIAELMKNVEALKSSLFLIEDERAKLAEENTELRQKNEVFETKEKLQKQTEPGRATLAETREPQKVNFWLVGIPLINRLKKEAEQASEVGQKKTYTRRQIQEEFLKEIQKYPKLRPEIEKILAASRKEPKSDPLDLEGWAMTSIRLGLGDYVQKTGGAPPKNRSAV